MNDSTSPLPTPGPHSPKPGSSSGFTLIELMVVVAVVAILVAVALPSYSESVRKGHRGQAKADLVDVAQQAERFRTVNNTYTGFSPAITQSPAVGAARYDIKVEITDSGRGFTAQATPVGGTSQEADRCGELTINQAGTKWHAAGTDAECGFGTLGPGS